MIVHRGQWVGHRLVAACGAASGSGVMTTSEREPSLVNCPACASAPRVDALACAHCGGIANHRVMPDGTACPTARVLGMLRGGRQVAERIAAGVAEDGTGRDDIAGEPGTEAS